MKQLFYAILISLLLTGCPTAFYGNIKNDSGHSVTVQPPRETDNSWAIKAGNTIEVNWYQECITIKDGDTTQYFVGWPVPEEAVSHGLFSSTVNATYKNNELYFNVTEGKQIKIKKVASCDKP